MMKNKRLLITGGTGSFGNAVLNKFVNSNLKEIIIFSRDEKKQDDLRKKLMSKKVKFIIGDVRDRDSLINATRGVDYIFHAAALKQVPNCEFFPMEAVKTNVIGTENMLEAAIQNKVKKVICLSTDKAVYPINAMGISKAMMEKVIISKSRESDSTQICITRYGNVMASRGSVIPLFTEQIMNNQTVTITDPDMTRFMMTLQEAVDLVLFAFLNGENGDLFVQKSPASTIEILFECLKDILKVPQAKAKIIGTRHGEKSYEVLLSKEERHKATDLGNYYKISPDNRSLNYDLFFTKGSKILKDSEEYNSNNTKRLNKTQLKKLLKKVDYLKDYL